MNRLVLSAKVVERGPLRYTPAGLPAFDLCLRHASTVTEDGTPRQVSMDIKAVAIGAIAQTVGRLAMGADGQFAGFLAATRNGRGLLFHITAIDSPAA